MTSTGLPTEQNCKINTSDTEDNSDGIGQKIHQTFIENLRLRNFHCTNLGVAMLELFRDYSHDNPEAVNLAQPIPLQTDGFPGYIDLHIGNIFETISLYYVIGPIVESIVWTIGKISKQRMQKQTVFKTKVLAAILATSALEFKVSNGDPEDLFGVAAGAIVLISGYESFSPEGIINQKVKNWVIRGVEMAKDLDNLSQGFEDWPHTQA
jgi:hypothetical protein